MYVIQNIYAHFKQQNMKPEFYVIEKKELKEALREFSQEIQNEAQKNPVEQSERLTRKEAEKFLAVSYSTMHQWTKKRIIQEHGQGRKRFYLRSELIDVLSKKL